MTRSLVVLATLALLAASPAPPAPPAPPTPHPGHDRLMYFSSGGSWLGVSVDDVTADRARELNMKEETGAEIKSVAPESPAAEAGLEEEDVILEYQGSRVEGAMQLTRMVHETPAGRTVTLKVLHGGQTRTAHVKMTEHEGDFHRGRFNRRIEIPPIEIPDIDIPDIPDLEGIPSSFRLGVSVEDLGGQLGEYFGLKDGEGVLVRSVKKGTPADAAGMKAGDVIIKVDGERITDSGELRSALRGHRGKTFPVAILRDRKEQSVNVSLPKSEDPSDEGNEESRYRSLIDEKVRGKLAAARQKMRNAFSVLKFKLGTSEDSL